MNTKARPAKFSDFKVGTKFNVAYDSLKLPKYILGPPTLRRSNKLGVYALDDGIVSTQPITHWGTDEWSGEVVVYNSGRKLVVR